YSTIVQWYRLQRSPHYRYPTSMDDIQIIYESRNYIVVNKDDLVPIDSFQAPAQVNISEQTRSLFYKRALIKYHDEQLVDKSENTMTDKLETDVLSETNEGKAQLELFEETSKEKAQFIRYIHRLDLDTSGCMCFAKSDVAAALAYKAFVEKRAIKYYLTLVHGHIHSPYPSFIDKAIGENAASYGRIMCTDDFEYCNMPKPAQTHVDILQRRTYDGKPAAKCLVRILTGKRHQIRLHLAHIGHPVIGDYIYTHPIDYKPHRIMLHARSLTIHSDMEVVDALAPDPFKQKFDPLWKPEERCYPLNKW
ncbi:unnamed protein product, partial [Didymodactylos carnosus]